MAEGLTIAAIARYLQVREETVRHYIACAYRKLGVHTRDGAIAAHTAWRAQFDSA